MASFSLQFPTTDSWLKAMGECLDLLARLPNESDADRAELLLRLAHTRRVAPVQDIWKTATATGGLDRALAACALLGEPKASALLTAIAAHFAEARDEAAFDRVWPLVAQNRPHAEARGNLDCAALAKCAEFRPSALAEIARLDAGKAREAFRILARGAPADTVAAAFKALEDADLNQQFEGALSGSLAFGGRAELAWACLPLIHHRFTEKREQMPDYVCEPNDRRDLLRSKAVWGLTRQQRFEEALQFLATYEGERLKVSDAVDLQMKMGNLLKARDLLTQSKEAFLVTMFDYEELANALGAAGEIEAVLEVAEAAARYNSKSFAADVVKDGLESAIKAGHSSAVTAVLDRVIPPRARKKLQDLIARVSPAGTPATIRAQADLWLKTNETEAIQKIEEALPAAQPADRIYLRCTLLRAHARAGHDADVQRIVPEIKDEVQSIKKRADRIEATQQAAAALVAAGMRWEALMVMDATGKALEICDKQEMRDVVHGFVEACEALRAKDLLVNLTEKELHNTGFGMFIDDHLKWLQSASGDLEQTIAKTKASGDFSTTIDMLRAQRKFADAAAVLRHAPKPREIVREEGGLIEEAAEAREDSVVLDLLATIGSPIPGEHAAGTSAITLLKSYSVRSSFGLPGGKLENLVHALAEPLDCHVRESARAALAFAEKGDFDEYNNPVNGARRIKEKGGWEEARAYASGLPREEHSVFPSEVLLDLARLGIYAKLPAANLEDILRECCERLKVIGRRSYDARKLLAALIHIHLAGTRVPGVEDKARALLDYAKSEPVPTTDLVHCHAVLGEWDEALALLPLSSRLQHYGIPSSYDQNYPWRILRIIPLHVLRAKAAAAAIDLPAAWFLAAALAARQEKRSAGFLAKLLGDRRDDRQEIIESLKQSINSIPESSIS